MIKKNTRNFLLAILCAIFLVVGLIYYFNYSIDIVRHDYETKFVNLERKTAENLQELETQIKLLGSNLSSQILFVKADLRAFKKQNQQQIDTQSKLIDQIEQQSNIKLNELRNELKNIKIQSADFTAILDDVLQSVVSVKTDLGQGSGAIINKKGYVVTNVHVIRGASTIKVTTYSGDTFDVEELVGYDSVADIAVLKINAPASKALNFGDSDALKVGEKVIAAGNPVGLSFTVTEGIVSAFRTAENKINYIQTDVPINPGNSGGPLINTKGEIVGINNFKVSGFEGLGFAISSNKVKSVVTKLINDYETNQNH